MFKIDDNLKIHYPLNLIPRKQQIDGFKFVKNAINTGNKYMLLNLPTGTGKSYFVIMFINWYLNYINKTAKFDILTNSKILQDQYINDYSYIKNFKGRANYYCDPHNTDCSNGYEICKTLGPHCKMECPYEKAKAEWIGSKVGLTNFHLFDTLSLYLTATLDERESNVLIIDESHDFESVFCDFISTNLSTVSLKKYGFNLKEIENYDNKIRRIDYLTQYIGFIQNQFISDIEKKADWLKEMVANSKGKTKTKYTKYLTHCESQVHRFKYLLNEYSKDKSNWVLDVSKIKSDKMYSGKLLEAKPVWANRYIKDVIWDNYDHIIFMSGTILNKTMFSYINGLEDKYTKYFEIPSPFPINRRPIYYLRLGKMTYNEKEETFKKQLVYIKKILAKNKDKKGIIHTYTYEFSEWLQKNYYDNRLIYHKSENRDEMLQKHIVSKSPSVIVSPSMMSGIDLKDDLSRFQIIMKIPFPYLGSNKIKQRQKTNKQWYSWKTIVDLVQMYGRSNRSVEDWAETYILDSSFSDVLKYNGDSIPRWFTNAIKELKLK